MGCQETKLFLVEVFVGGRVTGDIGNLGGQFNRGIVDIVMTKQLPTCLLNNDTQGRNYVPNVLYGSRPRQFGALTSAQATTIRCN